jgi:hypothetical protein
MAIPNKVTSTDQVQDGFRKLNQTIDNIVTGVTFLTSSKTLTFKTLNGTSLSTNITIGNDSLVSATKIVSASGTIGWSAPISATTPTIESVYKYIFGVPYVINMASDAGKYIELTIDGAITGTYDQNRYYNIQLIDRTFDGDSFLLKINSNHNTPSKVSSATETTLVGNNALYLFTYSTGSTTWHSHIIQEATNTQVINSQGYYSQFIFSSITSSATHNFLEMTTVTPNVLALEQPGKYVINYNYGNTTTSIWLPSATTFPYKEIEILDLTPTNSASNNSNNKKKISSRYNQRILTFGSQYELPYFQLNEQNQKYAKFVSNGIDWILVEPHELFRTPLEFIPKFASFLSPATASYTAQTTSSNGLFWFSEGMGHYNFEYRGKIVTNQPSSDIMVALPYFASTDSDQICGLKNVILMTSAGTKSVEGEITYNGSSTPSALRIIKTNFPAKTYYQWSDIGNETYIIKGDINYGVAQSGGNTFFMLMDQSDFETQYAGYFF